MDVVFAVEFVAPASQNGGSFLFELALGPQERRAIEAAAAIYGIVWRGRKVKRERANKGNSQ